MLSQGVAGSSLDQGSTPTPPTRSFVSQVKPAFLPLIALRLRDTWFVYEVDPVVHEPLYPLDGVAWRRNAMPSPPFRLWNAIPRRISVCRSFITPPGRSFITPPGVACLRYPVGYRNSDTPSGIVSFIRPRRARLFGPAGQVVYNPAGYRLLPRRVSG